MNYYRQIPKDLRKTYKKKIRRVFFAAVKSFFLFPVMYSKRKKLYALGTFENNLHLKDSHLYWLTDSSEVDFDSCWYGDPAHRKYGLMKLGFIGKFLASFNWVVIRNSAWNLKLKMGKNLQGERLLVNILINTEQDQNVFNWRDQTDKGILAVLFGWTEDNGTLHFAYSHTKPLGKFNPFRLLGYKWSNKMRGADKGRYLYKNRLFKKLL